MINDNALKRYMNNRKRWRNGQISQDEMDQFTNWVFRDRLLKLVKQSQHHDLAWHGEISMDRINTILDNHETGGKLEDLLDNYHALLTIQLVATIHRHVGGPTPHSADCFFFRDAMEVLTGFEQKQLLDPIEAHAFIGKYPMTEATNYLLLQAETLFAAHNLAEDHQAVLAQLPGKMMEGQAQQLWEWLVNKVPDDIADDARRLAEEGDYGVALVRTLQFVSWGNAMQGLYHVYNLTLESEQGEEEEEDSADMPSLFDYPLRRKAVADIGAGELEELNNWFFRPSLLQLLKNGQLDRGVWTGETAQDIMLHGVEISLGLGVLDQLMLHYWAQLNFWLMKLLHELDSGEEVAKDKLVMLRDIVEVLDGKLRPDLESADTAWVHMQRRFDDSQKILRVVGLEQLLWKNHVESINVHPRDTVRATLAATLRAALSTMEIEILYQTMPHYNVDMKEQLAAGVDFYAEVAYLIDTNMWSDVISGLVSMTLAVVTPVMTAEEALQFGEPLPADVIADEGSADDDTFAFNDPYPNKSTETNMSTENQNEAIAEVAAAETPVKQSVIEQLHRIFPVDAALAFIATPDKANLDALNDALAAAGTSGAHVDYSQDEEAVTRIHGEIREEIYGHLIGLLDTLALSEADRGLYDVLIRASQIFAPEAEVLTFEAWLEGLETRKAADAAEREKQEAEQARINARKNPQIMQLVATFCNDRLNFNKQYGQLYSDKVLAYSTKAAKVIGDYFQVVRGTEDITPQLVKRVRDQLNEVVSEQREYVRGVHVAVRSLQFLDDVYKPQQQIMPEGTEAVVEGEGRDLSEVLEEGSQILSERHPSGAGQIDPEDAEQFAAPVAEGEERVAE